MIGPFPFLCWALFLGVVDADATCACGCGDARGDAADADADAGAAGAAGASATGLDAGAVTAAAAAAFLALCAWVGVLPMLTRGTTDRRGSDEIKREMIYCTDLSWIQVD